VQEACLHLALIPRFAALVVVFSAGFGHDAWVKCPYAVADPTLWPPLPGDGCEAMYLCVNEGALSESQMRILRGMIRKTPGCRKPD
jgi:hypothetical protein